MKRVLLLSHEALKEHMSGPSIRNWELARALAPHCEVTLAAPGKPDRKGDGFEVQGYSRQDVAGLVGAHDVVQCSGFLLHEHRVIRDAAHLVVDLYGPFQLEGLHVRDDLALEQQISMARSDRGVLADLLRRGDLFLCASERQRDFWMGWLDATGRVNPFTHAQDPGFGMVRVVPFGLPDAPPEPSAPRFRGTVDGIGKDDYVVLWGGGIWNWFDPLTLIRAAAAGRDSLPNLRVIFPSPGSPSEMVPPMAMSRQARELSDSLGLTGSRVFFGTSWIPYEARGQMFREADVGVSLHGDNIETRYSFRTRVLDYLWAGLPILTTEGDSMADLVAAEGLGAVVGYGDVDAVVAALVALQPGGERALESARRSAATAQRFRWSVVAQPLIDYCLNPTPAADREHLDADPGAGAVAEVPDPTRRGAAEVGRLLRRGAATLRRDGVGRVVAKGREYVRRRRR
jgi:glycosyltransferase involved in cell wall biosynthesis